MNVRARAHLASIILICSLVVPLTARAQAPTVENTIRLRVEQARQQPAVAVRGSRLLQPEAVARFFEARAFAPAWRLPAGAQEMLAAIRNIEQDGLTPADYHLRGHHRRARGVHEDAVDRSRGRPPGAHRRCRGGADRSRALRTRAPGVARQAVERRSARRRAAARPRARRSRARARLSTPRSSRRSRRTSSIPG